MNGRLTNIQATSGTEKYSARVLAIHVKKYSDAKQAAMGGQETQIQKLHDSREEITISLLTMNTPKTSFDSQEKKLEFNMEPAVRCI